LVPVPERRAGFDRAVGGPEPLREPHPDGSRAVWPGSVDVETADDEPRASVRLLRRVCPRAAPAGGAVRAGVRLRADRRRAAFYGSHPPARRPPPPLPPLPPPASGPPPP